MTPRFILLIHILFFGTTGFSDAQKIASDPFRDADGNTYHQLFVDFHITELIDIKYTVDDLPVEGKLSADGYSVLIKNYPGERSVKLLIKDDAGLEKEVIKSRCFIDPVLIEI